MTQVNTRLPFSIRLAPRSSRNRRVAFAETDQERWPSPQHGNKKHTRLLCHQITTPSEHRQKPGMPYRG